MKGRKKASAMRHISAYRFPATFCAAMLMCALSACSQSPQAQVSLKYDAVELQPGDLARDGLAFITPSSVTGQEQDRQGVAFLFAQVLEIQRPDIPVTSLAETLGEINEAGMHREYSEMFRYYADTGILPASALKPIGDLTERRYVAMLKMASYSTNSSRRFSFLGMRIVQTKSANLRLFLQIWDTETGAIAWEANQELNLAFETVAETSVTFEMMVERMAQDLIRLLPEPCADGSDPPCAVPETAGVLD